MNKIITIAISLFLAIPVVKAQPKPFAQTNATWYYQFCPFEGSYTLVYRCMGDTVINGINASLIKAYDTSNRNLFWPMSKKVVLYRNNNVLSSWDDSVNNFVQIFDFSLKKKDSFKFALKHYSVSIQIDSVYTVKINNVVTTNYDCNGVFRKANGSWQRKSNLSFNDRFGGIYQILPLVDTVGVISWMNCFEDSLIHYKSIRDQYNSCSYTEGSIAPFNAAKPLINIYPNPAEGVLNIRRSAEDITQIEISILDMNGRQIMRTFMPQGEENISADISFLNPGIYVLNCLSNGASSNQKLIMK